MKLNVHFLNNKDEEIIVSYNLLENSVVDKFVSLINKINSQPYVKIEYTNHDLPLAGALQFQSRQIDFYQE
jgi:hypothetical protein